MLKQRKTVLFFPLNSPGHINSSLGLAGRLLNEHNCRTVFLLLGTVVGDSIQAHGHELIVLEEARPFEDFELEPGEDPAIQLDEAAKLAAGKRKRQFAGALKWPQVIRRFGHLLRKEPLEALTESMEVMERFMVEELVENHPSYARAIERLAPDLIVVDAYFVPPCVVNAACPWIRLFSANPLGLMRPVLDDNLKPPAQLGLSLLKDRESRLKMRREQPDRWRQMLREWQEANERIGACFGKTVASKLAPFMEEQGCPLQPGQQAHDSPHLNLYMFPRALDYHRDQDILVYPPRWLGCDSLVRPRPPRDTEADEWQRLINEGLARLGGNPAATHIVYFSLGTLASGDIELMRRFLEIFAQDSKRLYVVSKGMNGDQLELAENMVGANYVPQTLILQRAHLAIIHGGNNSLTECLHYGVPMIVMPVFADQLDNAQRVEDLGFGKRLNVFNSSKDELLEAVEATLSNQELRQEMDSIGQEMRARDDLSKAVALVRRLLEEGRLDEAYLNKCRDKSGAECSLVQ